MRKPAINPFLINRLALSPVERAMGRVMRAPDGHADGGAADASATDAAAAQDPAAATDPGAADAAAQATQGDQQQGAGDGDAKADGEDGSFLGTAGQGEGQEGAEGEGEKDAGGDEGAAAGAPEKYELTPPEGFEAIDPALMGEAEPVLRELNLSNEQAQKLVPLVGKAIQDAVAKANDAGAQQVADMRKGWADAFDADPEIGGANRKATEAAAAKAFDHYGLKPGEGLRQLLDESGIGNHPDMIRFVARVGRDLAEGSFERGDTVPQPKTPEQKLYGEEFQPKG